MSFFTALPTGSDDPDPISEGDNVREFAWSPDDVNESLAYSSERVIFTASPNGGSNKQVTPDLTVGGSISDFSWAPDSSRIAYRADQRFDGIIELFTVRPDGEEAVRLSGSFAEAGDVLFFEWVP